MMYSKLLELPYIVIKWNFIKYVNDLLKGLKVMPTFSGHNVQSIFGIILVTRDFN